MQAIVTGTGTFAVPGGVQVAHRRAFDEYLIDVHVSAPDRFARGLSTIGTVSANVEPNGTVSALHVELGGFVCTFDSIGAHLLPLPRDTFNPDDTAYPYRAADETIWHADVLACLQAAYRRILEVADEVADVYGRGRTWSDMRAVAQVIDHARRRW